MSDVVDVVEKIVESIYDKQKGSVYSFDFAESSKRFRSPWDKCPPPGSVSDWKLNRRRVDDAGYVPLSTQIKRMIADGERLEAFRSSPEYRRIYEELAKQDEQLPSDDLLYMSRVDLLAKAHELRSELDAIRTAKPIQNESKAEVPPPTPPEQTVSTPDNSGSSE